MDLSSLKTTERFIEIVHPKTGENLGVRVSIVALNDVRLKSIKRKIQDEKLRLEARGKNFKSEDIEENMCSILFNAMTGWEWAGDANFKGNKPDFTRENVVAVFKELPWFQSQIDEAVSDEKSFF